MRSLSVALCSLTLIGAVAAQEGDARDRVFAIADTQTEVRLQTRDGVETTSVSRDGGRTWLDIGETDHRLMLRFAERDPTLDWVIPGLLLSQGDTRLQAVQFHSLIVPEYRDALISAGVEVHNYLPFQTYLVRGDRDALAKVTDLPFVRWVGPYHPAFKLEPEIIADLTSGAAFEPRRYNVVMVDPDADAERLENAIVEMGGRLDRRAEGDLLVEATLNPAQLMQVVQFDFVLWIDRWSAPEYDMNYARGQSGATYVENTAGINGQGIRAHQNEGVNRGHREFAARSPYRVLPISVISSGSSSHGTSTAGEIVSQGVTGTAKGILPFAQLYYTNRTSNRYNLFNALTNNTRQVFGSTASWGANQTTAYTSTSAAMDRAIFDHDIFVTNSQSNTGNRNSRPEAWAKNCAGIGGFYHRNNASPGDDCWCGGGSIGPASDGRIGVSFTGYYESIYTTTGSTGNSYTSSFGGTSGATPMVNGMGLAAVEMFTDGFFGHQAASSWQSRWAVKPHFTTVKALLAATTRQITFSRANRYQQGWGFPSLRDMYDQRDSMLVLDEVDVLAAGAEKAYEVMVAPGTSELRVAMQYADPAGNAGSTVHRVNSLEVVAWHGQTGALYRGNNGLTSGLYSTLRGTWNDRDTEECIIIQNPPAGTWIVNVWARVLRQDSHVETAALDSDFALVVNGIMGMRNRTGMTIDASPAGTGVFNVNVGNVPATWDEGFTLVSFDTGRRIGFGSTYGFEIDQNSRRTLNRLTPAAGQVLAFTNGTAGQFPRVSGQVTSAMIQSVSGMNLSGQTVDVQIWLRDSSRNVLHVSNVERITVP